MLWAAIVIFVLASPPGEFKYDLNVFTERAKCEAYIRMFNVRDAERELSTAVQKLYKRCLPIEANPEV